MHVKGRFYMTESHIEAGGDSNACEGRVLYD